MATRQYIGARYVPKFYQNSVDGSTQWQPNVVYEPLMYVTLQNGHMYLSKKQVPATIGTPAENIDYWLDIGDYNGRIEELQNEIDDLQDEIDALPANYKIFNVKDYGAKGDGQTDDTDAFTSCVNAFNAAGGGILFIPKGEYVVSGGFPIYHSGIIAGNGSTINATLTAPDILFTIANTDVTVKNLHLTGNTGVAIRTYSRTRIYDCNFVGFNIAVHIASSVQVIIDGCYFVDSATTGVLISSTNVDGGDNRIINCTWDKSPSAALYDGITLMSGGGLIVSTCKFLGLKSAFVEGIDTPSTSVLVFDGNSVEGCSAASLLFNSPLNVAPFSKCVISNNEIASALEAVAILDYSEAIFITGNYIEGNTTAGVSAITIGSPNRAATPKNVVIANNIIRYYWGFLRGNKYSPVLDVYDNYLDELLTCALSNDFATSGNEVRYDIIYKDIIHTIAAQTAELTINMFPNSICTLKVNLSDSTPDEIEVVLTSDTSGIITVTQRQASINSKLSVVSDGVNCYVVAEPTTLPTATITVHVVGQIKGMIDVNN